MSCQWFEKTAIVELRMSDEPHFRITSKSVVLYYTRVIWVYLSANAKNQRGVVGWLNIYILTVEKSSKIRHNIYKTCRII